MMRSENLKSVIGSKNLRSYYLEQMGIDTWIIRKPPELNVKLWVIADSLMLQTPAHGLLLKMLNTIAILPDDICLKTTLSDQLIQEINTNPPPLLLITGSTASQYLLKELSINTLRGNVHICYNIPSVVSYHPADLLQCPRDKKYAYQDLLLLQQFIA